ncbi:hypothetical protein FMM05_01390 [Flavobacterium zepuense]|uniref:Uncharacterized protein n=1 Tax=Flavobacterium zepuense TaxID=2593302 RepID=A0A552VA17_9FLAO|nr:hypothetical protein [Flavobacterium zepuense]TRW27321.1 hypothetical protein FMM05_01390 [Flavobacterium zepuense]
MELQEYFQSYSSYFWEWENEVHSPQGVYESATIVNGSTIGYEAYIMEVLEYLAEESIPPFGSLLLALIATNSNSQAAMGKVFADESKPFKDNPSIIDMLAESRAFLDKLAALPQNYKLGNKRKQVLQAVFSGCHNRISSEKAKTILGEYKQHRHHLLRAGSKINFSFATFQKDFRTLALLNKKYTSVDDILLAIGGLPQLPEISEAIAEEPVSTTQPDLVQQLIQDPRTFPVGSLIKRIWSGLNIPMHHFAGGRQPLGGISDLTNKGDFDKLLISEFANDDDVFMQRLANNEALYIEREVPPENDKFLRILLVDVSLKNWGTPKILAYAAALGVATHPKTNIECKIIAVAQEYQEVYYTSVEDVITGLDVLSGKLDASAGLSAFLESEHTKGSPEIFVISTSGALKLPAVQKVLNDHHEKIKYVIEPDHQGNLNFYKIQNRARKLVLHLYLPLEELWQNRPKEDNSAKGKTRKANSAVSIPDYPILFPLRANIIDKFWLNGYIYLLTANRSLYRTYLKNIPEREYSPINHKHKGCELLLENLSIKSGGLHALGREDGHYILVSYYKREGIISYHNLNTSEYHKLPFEGKDKNYNLFYFNEVNTYCMIDEALTENQNITKNDRGLQIEIVRSHIKVENEYNKYKAELGNYTYNPGSNILKNFLPACIDTEGKLHLYKHEFNVNLHNNEVHSTFRMYSNRSYTPQVNAHYDNSTDKSKLLFPDGSEIIRDKRGMFILISSNPAIPKIYLPASLDYNLGLAAGDDFAGNDYFYKDKSNAPLLKISVNSFNHKYLEPFINTILNHGA